MDDNLALQVGRVILAYGKLDQTLYRSISILQVYHAHIATLHAEAKPSVEEIDDRFAHRLKHFRRLIVPLVDDTATRLIDDMLRRIREVEAVRAHLAHGEAVEKDGNVRILHYREAEAVFDKWLSDIRPEDADDLVAPRLHITYTLDQLKDATNALLKLDEAIEQHTDGAIDLPDIESLLGD